MIRTCCIPYHCCNCQAGGSSCEESDADEVHDAGTSSAPQGSRDAGGGGAWVIKANRQGMCTAAYRELLSHVSPSHVVLCPVTFSAGLLGAVFEHNDHRYGLAALAFGLSRRCRRPRMLRRSGARRTGAATCRVRDFLRPPRGTPHRRFGRFASAHLDALVLTPLCLASPACFSR